MNDKGSILIMTLIFIFVFTLLGVGTIYHATAHNEDTSKLQASMEAFWLADAGIEYARNDIVTTPQAGNYTPSEAVGNGIFTVGWTVACKCDEDDDGVFGDPCKDKDGVPNRFELESQGNVAGQYRRIWVDFGSLEAYIDKALQTRGPIKNYSPPDPDDPDAECDAPGNVAWQCNEVAPESDFSLSSVFNMTKEDLYAEAMNPPLEDPTSSEIDAIDLENWDEDDGPLIIKLVNQTKIQIPNTQLSTGEDKPLLVLIDTTESTTHQVDIEGSNFSGILYVIGEAKITGNPVFNGAVFVQGSPVEATDTSGTPVYNFDAEAVEKALEYIPYSITHKFKIHRWKEIVPSYS